jgi:catechol 2,3-dioxygenase-like lactoylglutathione lyase family enzyme
MRGSVVWARGALFCAAVVVAVSTPVGADSPVGSGPGVVQIRAAASPYSFVTEPVGGGPDRPFYTLPQALQDARDLQGFTEPALSPDAQHYAYNDPTGTNGKPDTKVGGVGQAATHLTALSGHTVDVSVPPVWSPDGLDLAVLVMSSQLYEDDLYVVRADGSKAERVASDLLATAPAWSPDGNRLAYWRDPDVIRNGPEAIATVDLRTGRTRIVRPNVRYTSFESLVWSSNTRLLVSHGSNQNETAFQVQQISARGGPLVPFAGNTPIPGLLLGVTSTAQLVAGDTGGAVLFYDPDGSLASRVPTSSRYPIVQWVPGQLAPVSTFDQRWNRASSTG